MRVVSGLEEEEEEEEEEGGGAEPSSRVSRLLALCLHTELQIPEESHRPERTSYVSVHVLRVYEDMRVKCSLESFFLLIVQKFYTEGRSRAERREHLLF